MNQKHFPSILNTRYPSLKMNLNWNIKKKNPIELLDLIFLNNDINFVSVLENFDIEKISFLTMNRVPPVIIYLWISLFI